MISLRPSKVINMAVLKMSREAGDAILPGVLFGSVATCVQRADFPVSFLIKVALVYGVGNVPEEIDADNFPLLGMGHIG
jgi:hypothetical protein